MFVLTPVSAIHSGYPSCPAYDYERAADAAVHRAAYDYAVAHARAEALRQERAAEERRYREAVLREQARRRAEAVDFLEALYAQEHPLFYDQTYSFADAEHYRRRVELDAARRRAELLQQRQEAERARAAAVARKRAEAERRREAQRREQEHWIALLTAQFGGADISEKPKAASTSLPVPQPVQPASRSVKSELKRRLEHEADDEVREALQHLLFELDESTPAAKKPKVDKGKARETPATSFNLPKSKPETAARSASPKPSSPKSFTVPINVPSTTPSAPEPTPASEGADLHRTPAMTPAQAHYAKEHLEHASARHLSLGTIQRIEDSLRALEASFVFPADLDLDAPRPGAGGWDSDSETELAFTPKNKPVHAYEHALNGLLARLDAVESFGDDAVRGRRKEVVNKVERAIREISRRVEESRERARTAAQEPLAEVGVSVPVQDKAEVAAEVTEASSNVPSAATESTESAVASADVEPAHAEPAPAAEADSSDVVMQDVEPSPAEPVGEVASEPTVDADADANVPSAPAPAQEATSSDATRAEAASATTETTPEPIAEHVEVEDSSDASQAAHTPESVDSTNPEAAESGMAVGLPTPIENTVARPAASASDLTAAPSSSATDAAPAPETHTDTAPAADAAEPSSTPAPSSPAPSDGGFLLQSSPLADPAPITAPAETVEKAESDIDIVDSAEVLSELNDAEWSDVEAH